MIGMELSRVRYIPRTVCSVGFSITIKVRILLKMQANISIFSKINFGIHRLLRFSFLLRYNEVCKPGYHFGRPGSQGGAGHFTQVVWKASTKLGIGKADIQENGMKCTYIVGRYKPQGNFDTGNNDYQNNVLKGSFQSSYCDSLSRNAPFWDKKDKLPMV